MKVTMRMKRVLLLLIVLGLASSAYTQERANSASSGGGVKPAAGAQTNSSANDSAALQKVLASMDRAAASFKSAQADFVWDQYTEVVNAHDFQYGVMYIRKRGEKDMEMAANIWLSPRSPQNANEPAEKYVLYSNGKVRLYQPKIEQVTQYNAGKDKEAFESFLVLGFGGSGRDLEKQFEVSYGGEDTVNNIRTAKLNLTPRAPGVRKMFNPIVLWIDPARGISVQQQFFEPNSGDYRLAKYSAVELNKSIPDRVFKLKTTGKTKYVTAGM